jgi:hypothetical protein
MINAIHSGRKCLLIFRMVMADAIVPISNHVNNNPCIKHYRRPNDTADYIQINLTTVVSSPLLYELVCFPTSRGVRDTASHTGVK